MHLISLKAAYGQLFLFIQILPARVKQWVICVDMEYFDAFCTLVHGKLFTTKLHNQRSIAIQGLNL
jgi:hypothetical protein